jgi:hypothetical protein
MRAVLNGFVSIGVLALAISAARAGDASRYTLNLTGQGVRFTATMNGIPIGPSANPAESLAYSADAFMHNGTNHLSVAIDRPGVEGAAGVVLLGPGSGAFGLGEAPRLAVFACNPAAGNGVPACRPRETFTADVERTDAPDLLLWHASPTPSGAKPADDIAAAMTALAGELASAARAGDWSRLFYLTDIRKADMQRANPAISQDETEAAAAMQAARKGEPVVAPSTDAARLSVVALPGSLWAVQRTDGSPLLRIALGGAVAKGEADPERFGDLPERWGTGNVQISVAVYGMFDGKWQLVR